MESGSRKSIKPVPNKPVTGQTKTVKIWLQIHTLIGKAVRTFARCFSGSETTVSPSTRPIFSLFPLVMANSGFRFHVASSNFYKDLEEFQNPFFDHV